MSSVRRIPAALRLVASCRLGQETRQALQPVLSGQQDRTRIATVADIADQAGMLVCQGTFEPGIRRSAPA